MVETTRPGTSESKFEQLLDATPDAIVGVDRDGRIVLANNQTAILFGHSRKDLIGEMVETLVPDRFKGDHPGHRGGYFDEPRTRPMGAGVELCGLRKDGTEFPAEISLSSLHTEEGSSPWPRCETLASARGHFRSYSPRPESVINRHYLLVYSA
jgi:protein-histidine pros-kinase